MVTTAGSHANTIGSIAAGKLLAKAAGGRWGPAILILAGIVLLRKRAATRAAGQSSIGTAAAHDVADASH
jgi:hypothetical protein